MSSPASDAAWHPDPYGRAAHRYWDGTQWTAHVANGGIVSADPHGAGPSPVSDPAGPDPWGTPNTDPFAGGDPQQQAEPVSAGPDPWGAPSSDPFASGDSHQQAEPVSADPDPWGTPSSDPFASGDPQQQAEAESESDDPWSRPPSPPGDGSRAEAVSNGWRFAGFLLEIALMAATVIAGWVLWSLAVHGRGQTPAKQLLRMRVVAAGSGRALTAGAMAMREFVLKGTVVVGALFAVGVATSTQGLVMAAFLIGVGWVLGNGISVLRDAKRAALWDRMQATAVVRTPPGAYGTRR